MVFSWNKTAENWDLHGDESRSTAGTTLTMTRSSKFGRKNVKSRISQIVRQLSFSDDSSSDDSCDLETSILTHLRNPRKPRTPTPPGNQYQPQQQEARTPRLFEYLNDVEKRRARLRELAAPKLSSEFRSRQSRGTYKAESINELSQHYEKLKAQFQNLQKEHADLKVLHEKLGQDKEMLEDAHRGVLEENEQLKSESDQSQKDELEHEIKRLRTEKKLAEQERKRLDEEQHQKEGELQKIKEESDEVHKRNAFLKEKYQKLKTSLISGRNSSNRREESYVRTERDSSDGSGEYETEEEDDNQSHLASETGTFQKLKTFLLGSRNDSDLRNESNSRNVHNSSSDADESETEDDKNQSRSPSETQSDEESTSGGSRNSSSGHTERPVLSEHELRKLKKEWYIQKIRERKRIQPFESKEDLRRNKNAVKMEWKRMTGMERREVLEHIYDAQW